MHLLPSDLANQDCKEFNQSSYLRSVRYTRDTDLVSQNRAGLHHYDKSYVMGVVLPTGGGAEESGRYYVAGQGLPYAKDIYHLDGSRVTAVVVAIREGLIHLDSPYALGETVETFWLSGGADSSSVLRKPEPTVSAVENVWSISTAEQMALAVHTLGFSKRQLAQLFGVSRQAIYDWLKGGNVSDDNAARLAELARMLMRISVDTRRPLYHRFTTQPIGEDGPSILDLLCEDIWDSDRILRLLRAARTLTAQRQERRRSKRTRSSRHRGDDNLLDNLLSFGEG